MMCVVQSSQELTPEWTVGKMISYVFLQVAGYYR